MNNAKFQEAVDAFKKALDENTVVWNKIEARSVMQSRLMDVKVAAGDLSLDGYFLEHAHKIERMIIEMYSPRKHFKYKNSSGSGVEELKRRIRSSLSRLETFPSTHAYLCGVPEIPEAL
jgi:hypothetical protein